MIDVCLSLPQFYTQIISGTNLLTTHLYDSRSHEPPSCKFLVQIVIDFLSSTHNRRPNYTIGVREFYLPHALFLWRFSYFAQYDLKVEFSRCLTFIDYWSYIYIFHSLLVVCVCVTAHSWKPFAHTCGRLLSNSFLISRTILRISDDFVGHRL